MFGWWLSTAIGKKSLIINEAIDQMLPRLVSSVVTHFSCHEKVGTAMS